MPGQCPTCNEQALNHLLNIVVQTRFLEHRHPVVCVIQTTPTWQKPLAVPAAHCNNISSSIASLAAGTGPAVRFCFTPATRAPSKVEYYYICSNIILFVYFPRSKSPQTTKHQQTLMDATQQLFYALSRVHVTDFAVATGWQWTLAEEISALVVFAEHRGYGHSATAEGPFGGGVRLPRGSGEGSSWRYAPMALADNDNDWPCAHRVQHCPRCTRNLVVIARLDTCSKPPLGGPPLG